LSIKSLIDESGYSLVEVMASIMILTIAIIPMVGMFDMGLNSAVRGSDYDKARSLAKKQMEIVQSLPYATAKANVPNAPCTFNGSGLCEAANLQDPDSEFSKFRYTMRKQFVEFRETPCVHLDGSKTNFCEINQDEGYMRVTVVVGWGGVNFDETTYTTTSIKAK
jgi:Tfp pilus assembly protein PilV